ncbi:hypothetical protein [Dehalococcoides mccartyi]|uniref:hypothetical protein n=1 Tax=Dehalococcoides mccartyi TaxID=61435 RepID=UPI0006BDE4EE|nr:hypothetical protein [Dehalococcoides mccartyi]BAS31212.1 hypothetical protein IBK_0137 [Dehalococcoides mccartyi IBARAKI]
MESESIRQLVNTDMEYAREHRGRQIGRKRYDIPFANICKAMIITDWHPTPAAKLISKEFGRTVSPGFITTRIKRSGKTKEEIIKDS